MLVSACTKLIERNPTSISIIYAEFVLRSVGRTNLFVPTVVAEKHKNKTPEDNNIHIDTAHPATHANSSSIIAIIVQPPNNELDHPTTPNHTEPHQTRQHHRTRIMQSDMGWCSITYTSKQSHRSSFAYIGIGTASTTTTHPH